MISKNALLKRSLLCLIVDPEWCHDIFTVARRAAAAGADMIQYRDKKSPNHILLRNAALLKRIAGMHGIPFIVNDRLDIAIAVDADGLHIGQGDISLRTARIFLGDKKMIGVSAGTYADAKSARDGSADYIGIGPVFKTLVKPHLLEGGIKLIERSRALKIPVIAIGGITIKNLHFLTQHGIRSVAVIRAVSSHRNPYEAVIALKKELER